MFTVHCKLFLFDNLSNLHFNTIFDILSAETFTPNRPLIPGFERGVPNLLLCPQGKNKNKVNIVTNVHILKVCIRTTYLAPIIRQFLKCFIYIKLLCYIF